MKVLYFAWLRSMIGVGEEVLDPRPDVRTVQELIDWLAGRSPGHVAAFADLGIVCVAVNQDHVKLDHPVADGDEVAFFPPVTGG
ncbi:MAG: molybdopterin synthase sulfur carrier subunit [Stygiobacter sp.]|nr:MAG: molybdopterin synthase sulfur carrier subunit [Stygiobacter sp.]